MCKCIEERQGNMWELHVIPHLSVVSNSLENQVRQPRKCQLTKKSWVFLTISLDSREREEGSDGLQSLGSLEAAQGLR